MSGDRGVKELDGWLPHFLRPEELLFTEFGNNEAKKKAINSLNSINKVHNSRWHMKMTTPTDDQWPAETKCRGGIEDGGLEDVIREVSESWRIMVPN